MTTSEHAKRIVGFILRLCFIVIVSALLVYTSVYVATGSLKMLLVAFLALLPLAIVLYYEKFMAYHFFGQRKGVRDSNAFIPVMVHQLRAPLVGIRWGLAMLLNGEAGKLTDEQKKVIEESYQNIEKLMSYIRDILSLTNLDHYQYSFSSVDIVVIIHTALAELQREATEKKVTINFMPQSSVVPQIQADPGKIAIVIENLLENAIKYTISGGSVSVAIATEKVGLHIQVSDTGMGIPAAEQKKIFTEFFRAKNASVAEPHGSGIGLYISQDIVRAHQGRIWFESKEGVGSTFHVVLPYILKESVK